MIFSRNFSSWTWTHISYLTKLRRTGKMSGSDAFMLAENAQNTNHPPKHKYKWKIETPITMLCVHFIWHSVFCVIELWMINRKYIKMQKIHSLKKRSVNTSGKEVSRPIYSVCVLGLDHNCKNDYNHNIWYFFLYGQIKWA